MDKRFIFEIALIVSAIVLAALLWNIFLQEKVSHSRNFDIAIDWCKHHYNENPDIPICVCDKATCEACVEQYRIYHNLTEEQFSVYCPPSNPPQPIIDPIIIFIGFFLVTLVMILKLKERMM